MFGFKELSINFLTGYPIPVILVSVLLVMLAVFLYRRTNPPLPVYLKVILGGLRVIAVLALMISLAEPVITFVRQFERPRRVILLLDASNSMARVERDKSRTERIDSLLTSPAFDRLSANAEITTLYVGGNLAEQLAKVERDRTSLGEAFDLLQKRQMAQPADYWMLLSDGNSNSGVETRTIAARLDQPVMTVDMSSDTGTYDIGIADVDYNPVLFVGQPTELKLKLEWINAPDRNLMVRLLDSNRVVGQTNFTIDQSEGLGELTMSYVPLQPGQKILKLDIMTDASEENPGNNQRSFSVKILKSRFTILIVADAPDYEIGFLKRLLQRSDKYEVELAVTGARAGNMAGRFPSRQIELNRYDLVVLYDPDPLRLEPRRELLVSYLSDKGGALWVLMGPKFCERGPTEWLNELLPFHQSRRRRIEYTAFRGEPSEADLFHPAVRLGDDPTAIRKQWSELPPFRALARCDRTHPEAVILARASLSSGEESRHPILGYRRHGPGKMLASAALPFWTWGFVTLGFGESTDAYDKFLQGVMSWLTVSDDLEPIRVRPDREVFQRGETIRFDGFAFDPGFRPIPAVTGTVTLENHSASRVYETDLLDNGDGSFRAELGNVAPGAYNYRAVFQKDGRVLRELSGKIQVESFSLEEIDQNGDPVALKAMAQLSGGSYHRYEHFDRAIDAMDLSTVTVEETGEITLLNKLWLLVIFIGALCSEWLIRKINQLL
ncbi:MAG: hypothetical protein JSU74_06155 [Candidatus Zixiibacteriota bacterium]|nr:MAG: hypothetical protein JSU74_06155 [candidate division Zixibacteria bacterium]